MSTKTENEIEAIIGELEDLKQTLMDPEQTDEWDDVFDEIERRIDLLKEHLRTEKGV